MRSRLATLLLPILACLPACRVPDLPIWSPPAPSVDAHAVERIRSIPYRDGPDADSHAHSLDLYLPRGVKDFPVVVLVHGGTWIHGDNRCCGLYASVGEFLARHGIAAALPNYRLSPSVKHPEHVRDVARAVAWVHGNIADYGGRPDQLSLVGHSAGGHLVSLLATDERYLKAEGLDGTAIKGVVAVSGVYRIPRRGAAVTLGGEKPSALRLDQVLPLRGGNWPLARRLGALPGLPMRLDPFALSFGDKPATRRDASPIRHVRPGLPPFLLVVADGDLPLLGGMAKDFRDALKAQGGEAELLRIPDRNHHSIIFSAVEERDPVASAMLRFLSRDAAPPPHPTTK